MLTADGAMWRAHFSIKAMMETPTDHYSPSITDTTTATSTGDADLPQRLPDSLDPPGYHEDRLSAVVEDTMRGSATEDRSRPETSFTEDEDHDDVMSVSDNNDDDTDDDDDDDIDVCGEDSSSCSTGAGTRAPHQRLLDTSLATSTSSGMTTGDEAGGGASPGGGGRRRGSGGTGTDGGKKVYRCSDCKYVTDRKNNLKRHVVTMHEECQKALECCDQVFANKAALREHVLARHKHGYDCTVCARNFCRKALLKRHITVHSGQKDYVCGVCGYATSHKSNLDRHKRRHLPKDGVPNGGTVDLGARRHDPLTMYLHDQYSASAYMDVKRQPWYHTQQQQQQQQQRQQQQQQQQQQEHHQQQQQQLQQQHSKEQQFCLDNKRFEPISQEVSTLPPFLLDEKSERSHRVVDQRPGGAYNRYRPLIPHTMQQSLPVLDSGGPRVPFHNPLSPLKAHKLQAPDAFAVGPSADKVLRFWESNRPQSREQYHEGSSQCKLGDVEQFTYVVNNKEYLSYPLKKQRRLASNVYTCVVCQRIFNDQLHYNIHNELHHVTRKAVPQRPITMDVHITARSSIPMY